MKFSLTKSWTVVLTLLALMFSAIGPTPAHATPLTVSDCSAPSGAGRLVDQITAAVSGDTINFSCSGTITLAATITIDKNLTIDGTGQTVTISGGNAVRVLIVNTGVSLTLNNLTIANGFAVDGGAGIFNGGTLVIINSVFSSNNSNAIYGSAGTLNVTNSTFSGNSAPNGGGGISSSTPLTITNSTFLGNYVGNSVTSGYGGGIWISGWPDPVLATITNSTFSGNTANYGTGGGIFTDNTTLTIQNSTFSGNSANELRGGGGGIHHYYLSTAIVTLRNTVVANSTSGGNCVGAITNGGNNLDSAATCGWTNTNGSMSNTNPLLGALANNGGPTQTFALLTGSPAIDGVTSDAPNGAPSTDQRGVSRPQGLRSDVGAFELQAQAQAGPAFIVNTTADTDDGVCDSLGQGTRNKDCTLREAINAANALAGADTITFSVSGTITLGSTLPTISDSAGLAIDGTGQTMTISGNNAVRVMQVVAGASLTLNKVTIANGSALSGGGISNEAGTLIITNSTVSGNSTSASGAGILNTGTLTITNSTVSGNNTEGGLGGGVRTDGGTVTITNSTFSGNSAPNGAGAGIFHNGGTVTLRNTIVANSASGGNCSGTITNGGNNIDSGTTCGWTSTNDSMSNTNPLLGPLASNGGPTQTFALLTGSPAIDGVKFNEPNFAPPTDQRGVTRPRGARYDIGAYERAAPSIIPVLMLLLLD